GYSLLTAITPRMSAAAADADWRGVVQHLSVGSRYLIVVLVPITVVFTLAGEPIGVALFSLGKAGSNAERRGAGGVRVRPAALCGDDAAAAGVLLDGRRAHPDDDQRDHGGGEAAPATGLPGLSRRRRCRARPHRGQLAVARGGRDGRADLAAQAAGPGGDQAKS